MNVAFFDSLGSRLETIAGGVSGHALALRPIVDMQGRLTRRELRVVFFGTYKAGTTSLLNAIIGADLLPVRAGGATAAITLIRYAPAPEARLLRRSSEGAIQRLISFDDAARAILDPTDEVARVAIGVPLRWLQGRCTLIDLPGQLDDGPLLTEIEAADSAVMVLAADKVLSARERELARAANRLLSGNVVYAVNRMNMIDEDDREDVLDWVRTALEGSGNDLVGRTRLFPLAARARGRRARIETGLSELTDWLQAATTLPRSEQLASRARLAGLERRLLDAGTALQADLQGDRARYAEAQRAADVRARERERAKDRAGADRSRLENVRAGLDAAGARFRDMCRTEAEEEARTEKSFIHLTFQAAIQEYAATVTTAARAAIGESGISVADLRLSDLIVRMDVPVPPPSATEIGGKLGAFTTEIFDGGQAGRSAGASVGRWVDRTIRGVSDETLAQRVEQLAEGVLAAVRAETERYLDALDSQLAALLAGYESAGPDPELAAAREAVEETEALVLACGQLLSDVRGWAGQANSSR